MGREIRDVLSSARQILENALQGEADYRAGAERRLSGLYNAVTSGRSVTFVLQNLSSSVPEFEDWYAPRRDRMRADPVARHFLDLRNRIEKRGTHGSASSSVNVPSLDPSELMRNAPSDAKGFFLGDRLGRSGWVVELPDGSESRIYFQPPASFASTTFVLEGAPNGRTVDSLLREWLASVEAMYIDAVETFSDDPALKTINRPHSGPFNQKTMAVLRKAISDAGF